MPDDDRRANINRLVYRETAWARGQEEKEEGWTDQGQQKMKGQCWEEEEGIPNEDI
jgi:hypothetical protein